VSNKITTSKTVFFFCLSFILGIFFAPSFIMLGLFLNFAFYYFSRKTLILLFSMVFFLFGSFYFHYTIYSIPEEIESPLYGKIKETPITRGSFERVVVSHEKGKVLLYLDRYSNFKYGEVLKIEGNFTVPEEEGYKNYLRKDEIYHVVFRPHVERIGEEGNLFFKTIFNFREKMKDSVRKVIPFPQVLFLEAMLFGDRSSFPDSFNEKLSVTGTRHITAISGMHIVIISSLIFFLLTFLKIKRRPAAIISLMLVAVFITFVGAPVSAIRAGIMGGTVLLSYIFFRETNSLRLVVFAATLMLLFNPLLLHYDLGFQLSFMVVLGIIFLYRPVKKFLTKREASNNLFLKIRVFLSGREKIADILAITISAQLFVFPLILYNFGHFSLYSIFTNLLIVPLLPFIIVFGFLAALSGSIIFSFPVYLLLSLMLSIINTFYNLPFSAVYIKNVPFLVFFLFYLFLFSKTAKKRADFSI
jgi:competence protein ComEC